MSYYNSKYHIGLNSKGYIISQRNGVRYYQKKRAPLFVNKSGSGDSSYRDATFWQYFVQTNWRNGAKQLKFDDPGKFWKSNDVNTTQLEELTLSKAFVSAGQLASGVGVNVLDGWRADPATTIAFDAASSGGGSGASTTLSWSHTCTGANRLLVVGILDSEAGQTVDNVTGVTYGGVAMTKTDASSLQTNVKTVSMWYLLSPAAGSNTITVTKSTSVNGMYGIASSYTGVLALDAHATTGNSSGGTTFNESLTTTADNCWVIWMVGHSVEDPTAGADTTRRQAGSFAHALFDSNGVVTPAGSKTLNAAAAAGNWAACIASFSPVLGSASTSSVVYGGTSDGKIYTWDNTTTWTEVFDTRRLTWFETGTDADKIVGDTGGTETAQSQGFQIAAATKCKAVQVYIKKNAGTPGDITVRIETDSTAKPSGTLVDAAATTTISAFTTATYGWVTATFTTSFSLAATTTYHVVLKTAAASNDNNYAWAADTSSPGYSGGAMSASTDGGSTWSAVSGSDAYFRILGNATSVNCSLVTKVGGTKKIYFGSGDPAGIVNGDARLYSYDGTTWALTKTFVTATESNILSLIEYTGDNTVKMAVGPQARVYKTSDFSTFTLDKDIDVPQNPGYPYALKEYNSSLYVGGGSPELVPDQYYNGFLFYYDTTTWRSLYPFDFTVIKSMEFYDAFLFIGTYHGHLYVFDTSSLNPLFNWRDQYNYQVEVRAMKYFDDKLYIALNPQSGTGETNVGIWVFDRRGLTLAHTISGVTGYRCFGVINGSLLVGTGDNGYVYKLSTTTYATTGEYQSSYFDANLPSIAKLWNAITIRHDPLVSGQSLNIYYKFKEADSWTQLTTGVDNSVGSTEQTLTFATGTNSKKISLRAVLNGGGSNTPKLTEVVVQYSLYPDLKWQWNLRLKAKSNLSLADGTQETRSATTIRTDLEALMNSKTLYTFVDVDGTSHNVMVNNIDQPSWVVNPDDVNEDEIALTLLEA